ncbi:META domain-containing protein [Actinomycetes bacterium KLBMP 9797]
MPRLINITVLLALAAGGGVAASGYADGEIWQRTFRAVSVTEDGQPRELLPGYRIRVEFPNGGVRADAGCGRITASATLTDGRLAVSGLTMFRNGCTNQAALAQDAWLAGLLDRDPSVELTGHDLVLSDEGDRFTLTDNLDVAVDPPLVDTRWVIEALTVDGETTALPQFPQPYLIFQANGDVVAYTGCNFITNTAVLKDGRATLDDASITKRACDSPGFLVEISMFDALDAGEVTLAMAAGRLTVDRPGGPTLLLRSES